MFKAAAVSCLFVALFGIAPAASAELGKLTDAFRTPPISDYLNPQPFSRVPDLLLIQTKKKESSTCAKRDNQCSGTCVGNDAGKSCKTSNLQVSGSCSCQK